jgi:hypothetical protein
LQSCFAPKVAPGEVILNGFIAFQAHSGVANSQGARLSGTGPPGPEFKTQHQSVHIVRDSVQLEHKARRVKFDAAAI